MIKKSFLILRKNDPLILASSTAFFTTFSLSPILVILVNLLSFVFQNEKIPDQLFKAVGSTFGAETADQIESIVSSFKSFGTNLLFSIGGFIFLIFVATTLLKVVKQSINNLWYVRKKHVSRLKYNFRERATAFALILIMGILFVASLLLDTTVGVLQDYIGDLLPSINLLLVRTINIAFSLIVVTVWFAMLYKILPDAQVQWKVAMVGGLITGILFNIGKWILGKLLLYNNVVTLFGASASFVLILLFIFYSAFILYYGACVTYVYGETFNMPIRPGKYSDKYEITFTEKEANG